MSKPTTKKTLLILLILSLLSITAYSQEENHDDDLHLEHKCTHDLMDRPEPELVDVEEDFTEGVEHEGRNLASYSNLKITGYYNLLSSTSSSYRNYLQNDLIPPILSYFSATLKNKYPLNSVRVNSGVTCGHSTPSILRSGAKTDFFFMVATDSDSANWVASSYACNLASGSKRPIVGITTINRNMLKATSNVMLHEKNMICIMHEVVHTLGFSSTLYKYFLNSNGKRLSGHVTSGSLDGRTSKVLNVAPLTSRIRNHFGCSNVKGAYMENNGNSATAGSHFERRQFSYEFMTSGLIYQMQVSQFTLALLEGSGWYIPNYNYADNFSWGQGQGCGFLMNKCSSSAFNYAGFCKTSGRQCTDAGRGAGSCSSDSKSDGCKFIHPNVNYDCDSNSAANYARLPSLQAFGRGKQSKCFTGTLSTSSGASTTSFCFKYSCSGTKLTLSVGSHSVACTKKGPVSVSGYKGTINCPDPVRYCSTTGRKFCPRNCMGRGTCNNGVCACRSGFKGSDCALRSGF